MSVRAARGFQAFVFLLFSLDYPANRLVRTGASPPARRARSSPPQNSDYFGFDLRSEQNVSLDQCKTTCLGDPSCRAFTYNTKAKWCFLKSDYNQLKPFTGAVAGKVVNARRRARYRRAAGTHLLPVLDGRRGPHLPHRA